MVYHEGLQCCVSKIEYDFDERAGVLHLPRISSNDMEGAIKLFRKIDPTVRQILVTEDGAYGVVYIRRGAEWTAGLCVKNPFAESGTSPGAK